MICPQRTCSLYSLQKGTLYVQSFSFVFKVKTFSTWTIVTLPLPPEAFTADTQFRWSGPENCQECEYAIDFGMTPIVYCITLNAIL